MVQFTQLNKLRLTTEESGRLYKFSNILLPLDEGFHKKNMCPSIPSFLRTLKGWNLEALWKNLHSKLSHYYIFHTINCIFMVLFNLKLNTFYPNFIYINLYSDFIQY